MSAALARREALWRSVKRTTSRRWRRSASTRPRSFTRDSYYRHQVLAHARARATAGTGTKLRTPAGRSFLKKRLGSQLDINSDYLQAEFEVVAQMMYDTQVARAIAQIRSYYDKTAELKKAAADANYKGALKALALLATLQGKTPEQVYRQMFKWKQAKGFADLFHAASIGDLPDNPAGEYADLHQAMADVHDLRDTGVDPPAELASRWFPKLWRYAKFVQTLPAGTGDTARLAFGLIFKGRHEEKQGVKSLLGKKEYLRWQDLIPDGYEEWQPREGSRFYLADTIPARIAQDLLTGVLQQAKIGAKDIRKVLAKAQPFPGLVIPTELAKTLEHLFDPAADHFLARASAHLLDRWKQYVLMNPRRALKFNVRNLSGDADATFAFNPSAFKFVPQAAREWTRCCGAGRP